MRSDCNVHVTCTGTGTFTVRSGGQCIRVIFSTTSVTALRCTMRGCEQYSTDKAWSSKALTSHAKMLRRCSVRQAQAHQHCVPLCGPVINLDMQVKEPADQAAPPIVPHLSTCMFMSRPGPLLERSMQ